MGILHSPHREAITRQIAELQYLPDGQGVRRPRITLCVEGNISAGKSTFLRMIKDEPFELQDIVEVRGPQASQHCQQGQADARMCYCLDTNRLCGDKHE